MGVAEGRVAGPDKKVQTNKIVSPGDFAIIQVDGLGQVVLSETDIQRIVKAVVLALKLDSFWSKK